MNYNDLKTLLQANVYQNTANAVTGAVLQNTLMAFINILGVNSGFMGLLSASNKPTGTVDGDQFYIGVNSGATAVNVDCSAVGLGTIAITQSTLWFVYSDATGWHKADLAAGFHLPSTEKQSQWDQAYASINKKFYYAEDPGDNNILDGDCVIDALESNAVYHLTDVAAVLIRSYRYDDNSWDCTTLPETYIIMESDAQFDVNLGELSNVYRVDGTPVQFTAGKYMYIVRGNIWEAKTLV